MSYMSYICKTCPMLWLLDFSALAAWQLQNSFCTPVLGAQGDTEATEMAKTGAASPTETASTAVDEKTRQGRSKNTQKHSQLLRE